MNEKQTARLVITFVDGSEERIDYHRAPQDDPNLAVRVQEALDARHLMVEMEGKRMIYPIYNIRSIEVFPAPTKLPRGALKGGGHTEA